MSYDAADAHHHNTDELATVLGVDPQQFTWGELLDKVAGYVRENRTAVGELIRDHRRELSHALGYNTDEAGLESWGGLLHSVSGVQHGNLDFQRFALQVRNALDVDAHTSDADCLAAIGRLGEAKAKLSPSAQGFAASLGCRDMEAHAASYNEGYAAAMQQVSEPLPGYSEPDSTDPDHLTFAAQVILGTVGVMHAAPETVGRSALQLRDEATRIQAEQWEEELVTQVAAVIDQSIAELTRHLGVKVGDNDWRDTARAVLSEFDIIPKAGA